MPLLSLPWLFFPLALPLPQPPSCHPLTHPRPPLCQQVFYATKKEAEQDGYSDIGVVNRTTGQIHPFGGLRGDAKALWRDVRNGKEQRVRLVR